MCNCACMCVCVRVCLHVCVCANSKGGNKHIKDIRKCWSGSHSDVMNGEDYMFSP